MMNAECRMNTQTKALHFILHSAFCTLHLFSVSYLEPGKLACRGEEVEIDLADEGVEAFADGVDDVFHVLFGAFEDEFDSAVRQVFDVTLDVVLLCDVLSGEAETDALDAAAEDTGFAVHFGWHFSGPQ